MHTHRIQFTSQRALVGVILFYTVGTAMIAWHRERIVTPTSAVSSVCAAMSEMPNLPEPLAGDYWYNDAAGIGLLLSDENGSDLNLFDDVFCAPASPRQSQSGASPPSSTNSLENPESYAHNFDMMDNIEETNDTVVTSAQAMQVLTKIRTQAKCVEAILKKAVIEPYHINGQIEGLRITGLDKILIARDLLLKSGDIIRAVNGHPLNSKRQAFEIFKRARTRPIIKIELLRDGKSQTLLYYLM